MACYPPNSASRSELRGLISERVLSMHTIQEFDDASSFAVPVMPEKNDLVKEFSYCKGRYEDPAALPNQPISADLEALGRRLQEWGKEGFISEGSKGFSVDVYEIHDQKQEHEYVRLAFTTAVGFEEYLQADGRNKEGRPRVRIMYVCILCERGIFLMICWISSISQENSMAPLNITEDAMRTLLNFFNVGPDFLSALFVCGECPQASDAASGGFRVSKTAGTDDRETSGKR